jgi:hypothetical protein
MRDGMYHASRVACNPPFSAGLVLAPDLDKSSNLAGVFEIFYVDWNTADRTSVSMIWVAI